MSLPLFLFIFEGKHVNQVGCLPSVINTAAETQKGLAPLAASLCSTAGPGPLPISFLLLQAPRFL